MRRVESLVMRELDSIRTGIEHPDVSTAADQSGDPVSHPLSEEDALYWASTVHITALNWLAFFWDSVGDDDSRERITRRRKELGPSRREQRRMLREPRVEDRLVLLRSNLAQVRAGIEELLGPTGAGHELAARLEALPGRTDEAPAREAWQKAAAILAGHQGLLLVLARRVDDTAAQRGLDGELEFLE